MSKKVWVLLILAVVGVALLLGATASAQQLETVRLSEVVRSVFYAPQYVAIEKGFFEEEGISIELSTAWGADRGAAALISGSVDVGFFGPEATIYVYQQGAQDHFIGFAQLTARDGSFFMRRHGEGEFKWDDVRGQTIVGARRGGVPQMVLEWVLKQNGIQPFEDVEIVTSLAFEAAVGAFEGGLGDFIAQFEPAMSEMDNRGRGEIVASLGEEAGPITYTVYHARRSTFQNRPEMLERFTRAIHKGQKWVAENPSSEVATAIAGYFPTIEHGILMQTVERYQSIDAWPTTPRLSEEGFANLQAVMLEAGELHNTVAFDILMSNEIVNRVVSD